MTFFIYTGMIILHMHIQILPAAQKSAAKHKLQQTLNFRRVLLATREHCDPLGCILNTLRCIQTAADFQDNAPHLFIHYHSNTKIIMLVVMTTTPGS